MIILKAIGYGILSGIIGAIVFFCIGLYFEINGREATTELKYNAIKKEYYEQTVVEDDISGNTTSYFTLAGLVLGLIAGVFLALEDSPKNKTDNQTEINSHQSDTTSTK